MTAVALIALADRPYAQDKWGNIILYVVQARRTFAEEPDSSAMNEVNTRLYTNIASTSFASTGTPYI